MDPYVKLTIGDLTKRTATAYGGHLEPSWNEEFVFDLSGSRELLIEVKNQTMLMDELVGSAKIDLGNFLSANNFGMNQTIPLTFNGADAGFLRFDFNFQPESFQGQKFAETKLETTGLASTERTTNLEPLVHRDTVVTKREPVFIQEKPIVLEKEIIKEQPIITNKETIYSTQPIIVEKHDLRENVSRETAETQVIREDAQFRTEAPKTLYSQPNFVQTPIVEKKTEVIQQAPIEITEKPVIYKKDVVTEKPVIHEKDIVMVEKPVVIEKPVYVTKEFDLTKEAEVIRQETLVHPEVQTTTNVLPSGNVQQLPTEVLGAAPERVREQTEVFEKKVLIEQPEIHQQTVLRTEKEVTVEKPEVFQTRATQQEPTKVIVEESSKLKQSKEQALP